MPRHGPIRTLRFLLRRCRVLKRRGDHANPPPSTTNAAPVIQLDIGLARNKTALAMSSGVPTRASGRLAASRMNARLVLAELRAFARQHRSIDIPGTNTVHANVVFAVINGHGARQVDGPTFRGAIGRRARTSLERPSRADVDDAASAAANHVRHDFARQQIDSLQRHVESEVPFVLGEFDDVFANGDAGAVAENVDLAAFSMTVVDRAPAFGRAAHVAVQKDRFACRDLRFPRRTLVL